MKLARVRSRNFLDRKRSKKVLFCPTWTLARECPRIKKYHWTGNDPAWWANR